MKRLWLLVGGAMVTASCGDATSADSPEFGAPVLVARYEGDVVLAGGRGERDGVVFVDDRRVIYAIGRLPVANRGPAGEASAVAELPAEVTDLRGVASDEAGLLHLSFAGEEGRIALATLKEFALESRTTTRNRSGGDVAVDDDGVLVAGDGQIVRPGGKVVSGRWSGPVALAVDHANRLWAIDAGSARERARIGRGREKTRAKRHRFATFLPEGARPVAADADADNVYVCDAESKLVLRFHIGLDDVARRRDPVEGMRCEHDIAVLPDGSIVTAAAGRITHHPRR